MSLEIEIIVYYFNGKKVWKKSWILDPRICTNAVCVRKLVVSETKSVIQHPFDLKVL